MRTSRGISPHATFAETAEDRLSHQIFVLVHNGCIFGHLCKKVVQRELTDMRGQRLVQNHRQSLLARTDRAQCDTEKRSMVLHTLG